VGGGETRSGKGNNKSILVNYGHGGEMSETSTKGPVNTGNKDLTKNKCAHDDAASAVSMTKAEVDNTISLDNNPIKNTVCDILGEQFNFSRHKIVFGGLSYKCNKVIGNPENCTSILTYYQCSMMLPSTEGATWQPAQSSKRSTGIKKAINTNSLHITYTKCFGTLKATVSTFRGD